MKYLLLCLCLAFYIPTFAQNCWTREGSFAMLALNEDFKKEHLDPIPLDYKPLNGSMITFNTLDAKKGQAFYVPSDQPTDKVLILFNEWWGLNDYIKREAERWQQMLGNVDVYALDLYDGKVATDREAASQLSSSLDKKRGEVLIKGLLSEIGHDKLIGTLGWCMGGPWSFTAARLAGNQASGCVMYYGFPETDMKLIKQLQTDVLFIWASKDRHITKDLVDAFGQKVEQTGHKFTMYSFNADHAFANPSNPIYDKQAAGEAEKISVEFLKQKLAIE